MLFISDRFTKLTQVVPLKRITAYDVSVAFVEHWVFKYGAPVTLLSDNGSQFVAHGSFGGYATYSRCTTSSPQRIIRKQTDRWRGSTALWQPCCGATLRTTRGVGACTHRRCVMHTKCQYTVPQASPHST